MLLQIILIIPTAPHPCARTSPQGEQVSSCRMHLEETKRGILACVNVLRAMLWVYLLNVLMCHKPNEPSSFASSICGSTKKDVSCFHLWYVYEARAHGNFLGVVAVASAAADLGQHANDQQMNRSSLSSPVPVAAGSLVSILIIRFYRYCFTRPRRLKSQHLG